MGNQFKIIDYLVWIDNDIPTETRTILTSYCIAYKIPN